MKKLIVLATCLILAIPYALPEDHYSANISVGVKAGATLSQTMFSPGVPQKLFPGTMGGVMVRYMEEKHFGVIAEVNFLQRGWSETFDETAYSFSRRLSYIQIPLLAHIYAGSRRAKFFFNAGPELGFLIGEKTKSNFDLTNFSSLPDFPYEHRNTDQFAMDIKNKIDYGISAGLGMEINMNPKNSLLLEGRFYYGLNNIFGANKKDVFSASNGISIMISLGYMFRIK